jgi:predicted dehydrogenase
MDHQLIRVCVVGYGYLGKWHCEKVLQSSLARLCFIVEPFPSAALKAKERFPDVEVVSTIAETVEKVDAYLIITPTSTHFQVLTSLLPYRPHIFCEKPLFDTFKDYTSLESESQYGLSKDQVFQVGHSERFHQAWPILKKTFFFSQAVEEACSIHFERVSPFKGRASDVDVISDLMIHDLDLLFFLFQKKPIKIEACGYKVVSSFWDHVEAILTCADGSHVTIVASRVHVEEKRELIVTSSHGQWKMDLLQQVAKGFFPSREEEGERNYQANFMKQDHLFLEQEQFFLSITKKRPSVVTFEEAKLIAYWMDKIKQAVETQKPQLLS